MSCNRVSWMRYGRSDCLVAIMPDDNTMRLITCGGYFSRPDCISHLVDWGTDDCPRLGRRDRNGKIIASASAQRSHSDNGNLFRARTRQLHVMRPTKLGSERIWLHKHLLLKRKKNIQLNTDCNTKLA
jgi:hypothetical protein